MILYFWKLIAQFQVIILQILNKAGMTDVLQEEQFMVTILLKRLMIISVTRLRLGMFRMKVPGMTHTIIAGRAITPMLKTGIVIGGVF